MNKVTRFIEEKGIAAPILARSRDDVHLVTYGVREAEGVTLGKEGSRRVGPHAYNSEAGKIVKLAPGVAHRLGGEAFPSNHLKAIKLALEYDGRGLNYIITADRTELANDGLFRKSNIF